MAAALDLAVSEKDDKQYANPYSVDMDDSIMPSTTSKKKDKKKSTTR